jgi:hypothetical protein
MTIKVTKPEINIREKLSDLDFDKVPFQKMPAGSVLQVKYLKRSADVSSTSQSFGTIDYIAFSPKKANSMILVETDYSMGGNVNAYMKLKLTNATQGVDFSRSGAHYYRDNYDATMTRMIFTGIDFPNSIKEQVYKFQGRSNGTTVWFHTYGASADSWMRITEIAQ